MCVARQAEKQTKKQLEHSVPLLKCTVLEDTYFGFIEVNSGHVHAAQLPSNPCGVQDSEQTVQIKNRDGEGEGTRYRERENERYIDREREQEREKHRQEHG